MSAPGAQQDNETVAYIGVGSNMGDREGMLEKAVKCLREEEGLQVRKTSSWYATKPVGGPKGQKEFLNSVIEVVVNLQAEELLKRLLSIEERLGRIRSERWGPRCIDLDLLLYGEEVIKTEHLQVPHRLMHKRGFVLRGLSEIAPGVRHPVSGKTAKQMWQEIQEDKGK